jgi:nicotinamide riboside kinase
VQDGTRNEEIASDRKKFSEQLRAYYDRLHIPYKVVNGENYAVRLTQAEKFIDEAFF